MPPKKAKKKRPNVSSIFLDAKSRVQLDRVCQKRGMGIMRLLGELICWFVALDATEQSIVLGQVERKDVTYPLEQILQRQRRKKRARATPTPPRGR